jgi:hypothetical protein
VSETGPEAEPPSGESLARAMAAIALGVGVGAALSPRTLLRAYGVRPDELTPAGEFGWRLFAMRNLWMGGLALSGNETMRDAFLPIQVLDQAVFAHAFRTRAVPRPAAALAMATSGAIVVLDLVRRRLQGRNGPTV